MCIKAERIGNSNSNSVLICSIYRREAGVGGAVLRCSGVLLPVEEWRAPSRTTKHKVSALNCGLQDIHLAPKSFNRLPAELRQMIFNSWNGRDKAQLRIWNTLNRQKITPVVFNGSVCMTCHEHAAERHQQRGFNNFLGFCSFFGGSAVSDNQRTN